MRTFLLFVLAALGPIFGIFGLLVVFSDVMQAVDARERKGEASFSELFAEVEIGRVSEIAVHGRVYTFKMLDSDGKSRTYWARGPAVTREELLAWRPSNPSLPAPHIVGP